MRFFLLRDCCKRGAMRAQLDSQDVKPWSLVLAPQDPDSTLAYRVSLGEMHSDIISYAVWSTRLLDRIWEHAATGIVRYPIELTKDGQCIDGYEGIRVTGRGGTFDEARSQAVRKGSALMRHKGVYMEETGWDGSDVFAIPGFGIEVFFSERLATAMKEFSFQGVELVLNDECKL